MREDNERSRQHKTEIAEMHLKMLQTIMMPPQHPDQYNVPTPNYHQALVTYNPNVVQNNTGKRAPH